MEPIEPTKPNAAAIQATRAIIKAGYGLYPSRTEAVAEIIYRETGIPEAIEALENLIEGEKKSGICPECKVDYYDYHDINHDDLDLNPKPCGFCTGRISSLRRAEAALAKLKGGTTRKSVRTDNG